jgi:hypothetical protein
MGPSSTLSESRSSSPLNRSWAVARTDGQEGAVCSFLRASRLRHEERPWGRNGVQEDQGPEVGRLIAAWLTAEPA